MFFEINHLRIESLGGHDFYGWTLCDGTADKPGEALAVSPSQLGVGPYRTESEARSAVAAFRKKAGGMKFAKVVTA